MATGVLTLTGFLFARIAEDEAAASTTPNPERTIRDCQGRRRIINRAVEMTRWDDTDWSTEQLSDYVLGTLAETYLDHPDFRPEWRD